MLIPALSEVETKAKSGQVLRILLTFAEKAQQPEARQRGTPQKKLIGHAWWFLPSAATPEVNKALKRLC
jgi:hypothetical protein